MKSPSNSISFKIAGFALIVLFGFISFAPTLRVGFLWDDHEMIEKNPHITGLTRENFHYAFTHDVFDGKGDAYYRPFQTIANMVDYKIWGLNPFGYHLRNLLMHLLGACLLFYCLWRLLERTDVAFIAASLFAIHPIIVEQLLIIAGRAEIMSVAFTLGALAFALRKDLIGDIHAPFFFALACLSKESGVLFPAILFLSGVLNPKFKVSWKKYIPYAVILLAYLVLRQRVLSAPFPLPSFSAAALFAVRDFPTILVTYLRVLLLPVDLHSHRRMLFTTWWMWMSPILLLAVFVAALKARSRIVWCSIGLFLLGLLPKMPNLISSSLMLDHWGYVSGIGLYILLACGFVWMFNQRPVVKVMAGVLLVGTMAFWIGMSRWNISHRSTDKDLYLWALRYPTSSVVRYNLGLLYYEEERYHDAKLLFEESLKMNPDSAMTANGLALVTWKLGRPEVAVPLLSYWIQREPRYLPSYVNRAMIVRGAAGLSDLDVVLRENPHYENARILRETLLAEMGKNAASR